MIIFAHSKCKRYENRKIQGVALPKKERNGQEWKSSHHGTHHGEQDYGAVLLQVVLYSIALESSCQPIGGQEQGSRGNQQGHRAVVAFHPKSFRCACGKESSVWTYRKIRKNLAEFIGEKYRLTDLAFGQLTEPFISDFHHYLLDEKGFSSGTITIYVSLFKKMCRIAFERGLCKNLLFAHYRVGTPKVTTPKALSMSDFIKIRDAELPEDKPRLSVSRDLFLFACYAGTAFIDTVSITKANVKVLEDGDKWLIYNRKKTGTLARVKLLPEALELMAKYEDEARDTLFPLLNTNRVRIDLITICKLAETSKTYSYHSGSHNKIYY